MIKEQIDPAKNYPIEEILGSKGRLKILKTLATDIELNISAIVDKTNLNHKIVDNHIKVLKKIGLIQEKRFGRIRIYRYKLENLKARSLKKFIEIWENRY
ncbi:MAG: ArsR family transcriptional regulator [Promethearchaeia archaeon]